MSENQERSPNLLQALIPIAVLITLLVLNVIYFGDHTLDGANQFALILASAVAGIIAITLGVKWVKVRTSIVNSIGSAMPSILILLMIGALAGTWLLSGVVPTLDLLRTQSISSQDLPVCHGDHHRYGLPGHRIQPGPPLPPSGLH